MSIDIKITRTLDDEFVSDVLITAFDSKYGGCWYWAKPNDKLDPWWVDEQRSNQFGEYPVWVAAFIYDGQQVMTDEPGVLKEAKGSDNVVNGDVIKRGIQTILDHEVVNETIRQYVRDAVLNDDAGCIDADVADCIVQVGLWGEMVYG